MTVPSPTPILDRVAPLSPSGLFRSARSELGSGLRGAVAGAAIMVAVLVLHSDSGATESADAWIRGWFATTLPGFPTGVRLLAIAVLMVAALLVALALHEIGHVIAGICVAFRFNSMRVGRLHLTHPFRWSWSRPLGRGAAGMASLFPVGRQRLGPRAMVMLAGGPAANLATAAAVIALPFEKGTFAVAVVFWSLLLGSMNLVSFRRGTFASDGRRLMTILRDPPQGDRWLALLALNAELNEGAPPESLSRDFIAAVTAVRDDSFDTVAGYSVAYLARFYQHDDAGAAEALEVCLSLAEKMPEAIRESFMATAAVFQARRRRRLDLAEAWLADIPSPAALPGIREQAEAAILEGRGDRAGALRLLERVETLVQEQPHLPGRNLTMRLIRRWKSELEA